MSTIVVVRKNGIAVIAADTMTKLGHNYESAKYIVGGSKMIRVGDNAIAQVGHASFCLVMSSYFDSLKNKVALDSPAAIFKAAQEMHRAFKDDYNLNPNEDSDDPFESSRQQILIANSSGIFGLYALRSVQEYSRFYAFGSGTDFALGAMHALYESDLDAESIARAAIRAAADFDDATAEPIEVQTFKLKKVRPN